MSNYLGSVWALFPPARYGPAAPSPCHLTPLRTPKTPHFSWAGAFIWIVSNRKPVPRKGKVQHIDASSFWRKMRLGAKRKEMSDDQIADVTRLFGSFAEAQLATLSKAVSPAR